MKKISNKAAAKIVRHAVTRVHLQTVYSVYVTLLTIYIRAGSDYFVLELNGEC